MQLAPTDPGSSRGMHFHFVVQLKDDPEIQGLYSGVKGLVEGSGNDMEDPSIGGKLCFVDALLRSIKKDTSERVVLVSNFTQTLDIFEKLCLRQKYGFFRLDGSTPTQKRQEMVDKFNAPSCQKFVFLLSAKSGGVGLNLVGASRLVMFDIDWNPSTDLQAMARIHRDGQSRPVYVYRLLSSGTIEEKMYQRQLTKIGLSDALMDGKTADKLNKFTAAELRDLFTFHDDEPCLTHSLLGCECIQGSASLAARGNSAKELSWDGIMDRTSASLAKRELKEWMHIDVDDWRLAPSGQSEQTQHGMDELGSKDRVLWNTILSGEGHDEEQEEEAGGEARGKRGKRGTRGPVTFVFYSGGMELLFDNQKTINTRVPAFFPSMAEAGEERHAATIRDLIAWTKQTLLRERPELFAGDDGSVRSGILVLVNGADWELEGELDYELQDGDEIVFISTLHGG
ncbi:helicase [Dissophora globulifera]|uniref:Ubiquitin-related modifier 1 n=1 Tax=Dissophora globulifera TaxID=979702 RepID=A0A9P6R5P7_9FUNG|nr:helicase [Dissophora globulifera]